MQILQQKRTSVTYCLNLEVVQGEHLLVRGLAAHGGCSLVCGHESLELGACTLKEQVQAGQGALAGGSLILGRWQ